ncbi:MAG: hypothetical protein WC384_13635 [Prolixibacteraceae bacterium]
MKVFYFVVEPAYHPNAQNCVTNAKPTTSSRYSSGQAVSAIAQTRGMWENL